MNTNVNTTETTVIANTESEQKAMPVYDADFYTNKAMQLFSEFDVQGNYTTAGVKENIKAWLKNKEPLFELLRKHPNWNEEAKAIIIPAFKEVREHDDYEKSRKVNDLVVNCFTYDQRLAFIDKTGEKINNMIYGLIRTQFVSENSFYFNEANEYFPELKIHNGQKASRVVNKLMKILGVDKHPEYNKYFAALADVCNPLTMTKTSVLSANWLDFMTMSNGNSWSSCHGITPSAAYSGCYKAGCLSYGNDDVSLIFYTIENGHENDNDFYKIPKITRQVVFWQYPVLVQERLYPQCNDGDNGTDDNSVIRQYREFLENIFSVCTGKPNLWEKAHNIDIEANDDTFMYHDWSYYNNWKVKIKDEDCSHDIIYVGADAYCLACGSKKYYSNNDEDECQSFLYCNDCERISNNHCEWCGCEGDDIEYCEDTDEYLCHDCCDYCEYHERYEATYYRPGYNRGYVSRELISVPNYGYVCQDALENGDFFYCDRCEEWYSYSNNDSHEVDGVYWCDDCTSNDAVWCDGCGEYHEERNVTMFEDIATGEMFCRDYAENNDMLVACENCGEIDLESNMTEIDNKYYCADCEEEMVRNNIEQNNENE